MILKDLINPSVLNFFFKYPWKSPWILSSIKGRKHEICVAVRFKLTFSYRTGETNITGFHPLEALCLLPILCVSRVGLIITIQALSCTDYYSHCIIMTSKNASACNNYHVLNHTIGYWASYSLFISLNLGIFEYLEKNDSGRIAWQTAKDTSLDETATTVSLHGH